MEADYIIVGSGLTGCAVASRLKRRDPSLDIIVIEGGGDASSNPDTQTFPGLFSLLGSKLDWTYTTEPQPNTCDRTHEVHAGKALGGGSTINFGGWSRGDATDYDDWAKIVGDERWSYNGLLPYFRQSESFFDTQADPHHHGFDGPVKITSVSASDPGRRYPLREPIKQHGRKLVFHSILTAVMGAHMVFVNSWRLGIKASVKHHSRHIAWMVSG